MTKEDFDQLDKLLNDSRELRNQRLDLLSEKEIWEKSTDISAGVGGETLRMNASHPRVGNNVPLRLPFTLLKKVSLEIINKDLATVEKALEDIFNKLKTA